MATKTRKAPKKRRTPAIKTSPDAAPGTSSNGDGHEGEQPKKAEGAFGEQGVLIDVTDPDEAKILTIASRIKGRGVQRSELQSEDEKDRDKLKEIFHEKGITRFVRGEFEIDIKDLGEKVSVKTRKQDQDAE